MSNNYRGGSNNTNTQNQTNTNTDSQVQLVNRVYTKNTGKYERVVNEKGGEKTYEIISILLTPEGRDELIQQLSEAAEPIKLEIGITERQGDRGPFLSSYVKSFQGKASTQGQVASGAKKRTFVPKTRTA